MSVYQRVTCSWGKSTPSKRSKTKKKIPSPLSWSLVHSRSSPHQAWRRVSTIKIIVPQFWMIKNFPTNKKSLSWKPLLSMVFGPLGKRFPGNPWLPFFIGWFPNHRYFSRGLSSSIIMQKKPPFFKWWLITHKGCLFPCGLANFFGYACEKYLRNSKLRNSHFN